MTYTYKNTLHACYTGYITQAIVNNLAPLLFVVFQNDYGLSYEQVGRLILINFGVQILADVLSLKFADKIGYRKSAVIAHISCITGLLLMALLPNLLPAHYLGLAAAVIFYALGGGILEVIVSPIVNSMPGDEKESAMSLLHSFYCWGQVGVVLVTTLVLKLVGSSRWSILPLLWTIVPLINLFRFLKVPLTPPLPKEKLMPLRELFKSKFFVIALIMMLCAGASELTMSQWSSLFAEKGLHLPKVMGDLLGPCLFAVFMGSGRFYYGIRGSKINLRKALVFCGTLCAACFLTAVFAPWPLLSLAGCAFCGLSVSLMWPGTFSLGAEKFPGGGTALFAMLAISGDIGCSAGPWITGIISDFIQRHYILVSKLLNAKSFDSAQVGLKCGFLLAVIFPVMFILGTLAFRKAGNKK